MVDNTATFVFSSNMTVTRMVVAKNLEHWVPDASTLVLADFSGLCQVQYPSEAVNVESFRFPSTFAVLPLATRFKLKRVIRSSDG